MLNGKKYVLKKERDKNFDEINKWYKECERLHTPYIVIKTRTKYANIDFDHFSMPKSYDKLLISNHEMIDEVVFKLIKKYGIKKSKFVTNSFIISFFNIPIENAEKLAKELYDFINGIVN